MLRLQLRNFIRLLYTLLIVISCIANVDAEKRRPKFSFGTVANTSNLEKIKANAAKLGQWRPEIYVIFSFTVFFICCYGLKIICERIAPPDTLLQDLELDDIRIERFDDIENTLINRLRDPFGYSPMEQYLRRQNGLDDHDEDNPLDNADIYLGKNQNNPDSFDIREAANMLRTKAMRMVYSITGGSAGAGAGDTLNSQNSDVSGNGYTIAQQENIRKKMENIDADTFAANWDARMSKEKDKENYMKSKKEEELMNGINISTDKDKDKDVYRHKKGGPGGKGGGSNWDTWGDEDDWNGGNGDKEEKSSSIATATAKGRAPPKDKDKDKTKVSSIEHKDDSYHTKAVGEDKLDSSATASLIDSQFASRKVGGFQIASDDQWSTVRGRNSPGTSTNPNGPGISAAGGSFSQGSGPLARQNTMQAGAGGKALLRSSDKKGGGLVLDLSKVTAAPLSVKPPAPIKYGQSQGSSSSSFDVPVAPSNIPRPNSANSSNNSRPGSGSRGRVVTDAPIAPRGVPLPAPRPGMGMGMGMGPPGGGSPGGYRQSTGVNNMRAPSKMGGSPEAGLKIQSFATDDGDNSGYDMDVRGTFDPFAAINRTTGSVSVNNNNNSNFLTQSVADAGRAGRAAPSYTAPVGMGTMGTGPPSIAPPRFSPIPVNIGPPRGDAPVVRRLPSMGNNMGGPPPRGPPLGGPPVGMPGRGGPPSLAGRGGPPRGAPPPPRGGPPRGGQPPGTKTE
jgi:hypothetical protein